MKMPHYDVSRANKGDYCFMQNTNGRIEEDKADAKTWRNIAKHFSKKPVENINEKPCFENTMADRNQFAQQKGT
jgi:alkylhydroperoxidase family enzyme